MIVGACVGAVYFFYKLTIGKKERYFQFDDQPNDIEMAKI